MRIKGDFMDFVLVGRGSFYLEINGFIDWIENKENIYDFVVSRN